MKTNDDSLWAGSDYSRHDDGPGVQEVDSVLPQVQQLSKWSLSCHLTAPCTRTRVVDSYDD